MKHAFTLVELIVVLGVLAMLLAISIPVVLGMIDRGQSAKCLSNLRQIGGALNLYLADHDQCLPDLKASRSSRSEKVPVIDVVLAPYLEKSASIFACPADRDLARKTGTSYGWNVALNQQSLGSRNMLELFEAERSIPVVMDKEGWHRGGGPKVNFLYAKGHTARELKLTTAP